MGMLGSVRWLHFGDFESFVEWMMVDGMWWSCGVNGVNGFGFLGFGLPWCFLWDLVFATVRWHFSWWICNGCILRVWEMSRVCVAGVAVICGARSEVVGENWVFSFCASGFAAVEFLR